MTEAHVALSGCCSRKKVATAAAGETPPQAATPTQPRFIGRPVQQLERYLRDVVTAVGVVLMRHRGSLPPASDHESAPTPYREDRVISRFGGVGAFRAGSFDLGRVFTRSARFPEKKTPEPRL